MSHTREENDKKLFDQIAGNYLKKDLIPYCRIARKQRLEQSLIGIQQPITTLLEVGCGAGFTVDYLKGRFSRYTGIDYSENLINYANQHNNATDVKFACINLNKFASIEKYDVILLIGVLHHIPEPENAIKSLTRLLAPEGMIVINEPQCGNPIISLLRKIRKRIDSNYSTDQVEFTEQEIRTLFKKNGFEVKSYPQGVLSTPLAESTLLPGIIGTPLAWVATRLDPTLEKLCSNAILRKLSWNIVVHAKQDNMLSETN